MKKSIKSSLAAVLFAALPIIQSHAVECPVEADTFSNSTTKLRNKNYGAAQLIVIGSLQKTFLRFDLSALPDNLNRGDVARATVRIYVNTLPLAGSFSVYRVSSVWDEHTLTANFAPTLGANPEISGIQISSKGRFISFDLTPLVRDWISNATPNNGIALATNAGGLSAVLDTKENTSTGHAPVLEVALTSGGVVGGISAFGGETAPAGWLICDGSEVSRTQYAELFAVIGETWGVGNGTTTFNLPDLGGQFLRGAHGPGVDADGDRAVGDKQNDKLQDHIHYYVKGDQNGTAVATSVLGAGYGGSTVTYRAGGVGSVIPDTLDPIKGARVSSETRPVNAAVNYIIKY